MIKSAYALNIKDPSINPVAKFASVASILNLVIPILLIGAALAFFAMLLLGAYTIITAGGNPENIQKAQKIFKNSIIGLAIVLASYLVVKLIEIVLNINIRGL